MNNADDMMPVVHSDLSPVHKPDHRHRKARRLHKERRSRDPDGNEMVNRLIAYMNAKSSSSIPRQDWIEKNHGHIHRATQIYLGTHPRVGAHIKCGILADVSWAEIMQVTPGCDAETIAAFELAYFDVRPFLENPTYIVETVMPGLCPQSGIASTPGSIDKLCQFDLRLAIAYWGGWEEHLRFTGDSGYFTHTTDDILRGLGRKSEMAKSVLASLAQKIDEENAARILEAARMVQLAKREVAEGKASDEVVEALRELGQAKPLRSAQEGELQSKEEYCTI